MAQSAMPTGISDADRQSDAAEDLHLLDLLIVLSRRRRFILSFTGGVAFLTIAVVLLIPSRYTAETVVMPPGQNGSSASALLGQLGGGAGTLAAVAGGGLGLKNPGDLYVSLFQSRTVEDAVIRRFNLESRYHDKKMSDARTAFESHSSVGLGAKDGLIRISVTDRDPNMAAQIANGYVEEFRSLSAGLAITEASQRREFFQTQMEEANENLTAAEEAMKRTEQTTGVLQVDSQARSLIESAAALRAQIVARNVQLQGMRTYATEDNPQMIQAKQQLTELQAQLAQLAGTDDKASSDIIMHKGNIPAAGMEYARKLRDVKYYEAIADLIAKQLEAAKLDEARQGSSAQIVDLAVPPDTRSFPKRAITVASSIVLGFLLACLWCVCAAGLRRALSSPAEAERVKALQLTL